MSMRQRSIDWPIQRLEWLRLKEIAGRAGQAIKFPDNDRVASANLVEHPLELWPIAGQRPGNGQIGQQNAL